MNLYDEVCRTAEGKEKLIKKALDEYNEGVDKANNERMALINDFIKLHTPEKGNIQVKELNDVLALIKGLSDPLSDLELLDATRQFNNNYATMEILKRELEKSHIEYEIYPETFKDLERKKAILDKLAELNPEIEKNYFKKDIGLTCVRYSLETLKTWEQEVLNLSK